jgi:hypothetical protein
LLGLALALGRMVSSLDRFHFAIVSYIQYSLVYQFYLVGSSIGKE